MPSPGPAPDPASRSLRAHALHLGLFALTCVTTGRSGRLAFGSWDAGLGFGGTLMIILVCHEMGHYLAARHHRIDASLPYFVPLPPQISLGMSSLGPIAPGFVSRSGTGPSGEALHTR